MLEGERGGRVSSQSRCGVGGWASLGVRALAKAGRGWSGRGSSGGQSSVIHAFCFGALSKSTRREVNWQKRRNEGTSCSQRSGCIGRQWLRDCRSTWMASANCLANCRIFHQSVPEGAYAFGSESYEGQFRIFPRISRQPGCLVISERHLIRWMMNWMRTSKLSKSDHSFS